MDVSRYLPLSNRPRDDESRVTTDERATIAQLVERAAVIAADHPDAAAQFVREAGLERLASDGDLAATAAVVAAGARRRVRQLADTTRALFLLADRTAADAAIPTEILGRVALYASTKAPFDRRAALSGHTVRAVDAGWEFGRGPVLEGTALEIARFLLGLSDTAPKAPPRQPPEVSAPMSPDATI